MSFSPSLTLPKGEGIFPSPLEKVIPKIFGIGRGKK